MYSKVFFMVFAGLSVLIPINTCFAEKYSPPKPQLSFYGSPEGDAQPEPPEGLMGTPGGLKHYSDAEQAHSGSERF